MIRDADVLSLLMSRQTNHSLPRAFYLDSDLYQIDLKSIWYRDWVLVATSPELPKTGSYLTIQLGDYSVIVVKGADGKIRALHNSCRHRGSRICTAQKGNAPKLVCPYHQWTYELDGRLLYAREMGGDFKAENYGLKPVHCEEAAGLIFICLSDTPPDFAPLHSQAETYLAPHALSDLKVAHQSSIIEQGNWKLVMENNRECYHCSSNHPSLCVTFPEDPRLFGGTDGTGAPVLEQHIERCEKAGLPSKFRIAHDEQWRFIRIPFLKNASSYTLDGKPAVSKRVGAVPFDEAGSLLLYHFPNSWNHFLSDQCLVFRILPVSPTQTEVTTTWLVHKDAVEGQDYDLKRLTEVWIATNDEDRRIVEENQRGIQSPAYEPGPYSVEHESGVIQFVEWYARNMQRRLTGRANVMAAE